MSIKRTLPNGMIIYVRIPCDHKKTYKHMKKLNHFIKRQGVVLLIAVLALPISIVIAQTPKEDSVLTIAIHSRPLQRVGNTFESIWLIDNQTTHVPLRKTFEFDIQHRFGTVLNGYEDLFGLYAPSNIRIGFGYTPINNLMLSAGFTKFNLLWDFTAKYAILKEIFSNNKIV